VVAIFAGRLLSGEPCTVNGDGGQTRDYVFVDDVARANLLAAEKRHDGALNVGTGVEADVNRIYRVLHRPFGGGAGAGMARLGLPRGGAPAHAGVVPRPALIAPPGWPEPVARHTMPSASRAPDDGAAEACLYGTSSSGRRRLPGAARQRAPQQGSGQPVGALMAVITRIEPRARNRSGRTSQPDRTGSAGPSNA
jgi:hypothetical protein